MSMTGFARRPIEFIKSEWDNEHRFEAFEDGWGIVMIALLLGLVLNFIFTDFKLGVTALMYLLMLMISFTMATVDQVWERNPLFETVGFGKGLNKALLALGVGAALILFIKWVSAASGNGLALLTPLATNSTLAFTPFDIFFVVVVAAFAEEAFFRSALVPTLQKMLGLWLGFLIPNIMFGAFHYYAYGGSVEAMFVAFFFGMVFTLGNNFFKSSLFGYGAHLTNNIIAVVVALKLVVI